MRASPAGCALTPDEEVMAMSKSSDKEQAMPWPAAVLIQLIKLIISRLMGQS